MNQLKEKKLNNKGFSLVELIIVIAIMAVLIGVLAPQYLKYVERSRQSADIDNVDQMISACEVYSADPDNTIVAGTISCTAAGAVTASGAPGTDGSVQDALDQAGLPEAALPDMRSNAFRDWTITFGTDANGDPEITFGGTHGGDLQTALGR